MGKTLPAPGHFASTAGVSGVMEDPAPGRGRALLDAQVAEGEVAEVRRDHVAAPRRTLDSIATPCSVNPKVGARRPPRRGVVFEITICDLKNVTS